MALRATPDAALMRGGSSFCNQLIAVPRCARCTFSLEYRRAHAGAFALRAPVFAAVSLRLRESQALRVRPPSTFADARFAPRLRPAHVAVPGRPFALMQPASPQ